MERSISYLIQLIAAVLIAGGGIIITCYMIHGEHCFCGWLVVLLGVGCLLIGSDRPSRAQGRKAGADH